MGKIIAIANQKGGVGKTTTAINLAAALAEKDKKTMLIDLDSQGNATSGLGVEKTDLENSIYDVIMENCPLEACLKTDVFPRLDILPSNSDLTAAEIELLEAEDRELHLKKIIDTLKEQYEYIIIDCPPSLNMLTINALVAADSVLIPIQCEYYALEGLSQLLQTIEVVKDRSNHDLKIEGIVFTMYDPRVRLSGQVVQNVRQNLNERTFKTLIPRNVRLAEAPSHGKPVMNYSRICSGTRAYRNLAKEIIAIYEAEKTEKINSATETTEEVNEQDNINKETNENEEISIEKENDIPSENPENAVDEDNVQEKQDDNGEEVEDDAEIKTATDDENETIKVSEDKEQDKE